MNIIYAILATLAVVGVVWLCFKYNQCRLVFGTLLVVVLILSSCYSGIQLNYYYSATGGIFGQLTGIFNTNVVVVEKTSFTLSNIELTKENGNTYSASIVTNEILELESNEYYNVYVNNAPCSNVQNARDYVSAEYRYVFYNEDFEILCIDTLYLKFAFYSNSTLLTVETDGGAEAVKFWNYYFNKNTFVVSINTGSYHEDDNLSFGEGEVPKVYKVCYVYSDSQIETKLYEANETLELKNIVGIENWTVNEAIVDETFVVNDNLYVYANFYDVDHLLNYHGTAEMLNGTLIYSYETTKTGMIYIDNETQAITVVSDYGYGWTGYSSNNGFACIFSNYSTVNPCVFIEETKTLYQLNFAFDYSSLYGDSTMCKLIYSVKNQEGFYLYDVLNDTTTKLHSTEIWTSFTSKFNEFTGAWSTVNIKGQNEDYYYSYDFIQDKLVQHDSDAIVGI